MSIQLHARTVAAMLPQTAHSANGAGNPALVAHGDRQCSPAGPPAGPPGGGRRT